jgi:hypothetical protein
MSGSKLKDHIEMCFKSTAIFFAADIRSHIEAIVGNDSWVSTREVSGQAHRDFFEKAAVICNKDAIKEAKGKQFNLGLHDSPVLSSYGNRAAKLTGANEVVEEVADWLSGLLRENRGWELSIPQPYLAPEDPESLEYATYGLLTVQGREVTHVFRGEVDKDLIRRSLVSMLPNHSVSWLNVVADHSVDPILCLVSTFDGDGWIVSGRIGGLLPEHGRNADSN